MAIGDFVLTHDLDAGDFHRQDRGNRLGNGIGVAAGAAQRIAIEADDGYALLFQAREFSRDFFWSVNQPGDCGQRADMLLHADRYVSHGLDTPNERSALR